MNWELERNFVDPNSSTGDKFGVGVTGSTSISLNHSVGGIILAGGSSICDSNITEDSMGTCASSSSANHGGWKRRCCGSRNFVFLGSSMMIGVTARPGEERTRFNRLFMFLVEFSLLSE